MNSLGVIGGADGPTAVFVTGDPAAALLALALAAAAVLAGAWLFRRKRKK